MIHKGLALYGTVKMKAYYNSSNHHTVSVQLAAGWRAVWSGMVGLWWSGLVYKLEMTIFE